MPQDMDIEFKGLHTDPNPHATPPGALKQAKNVVMRRKGIIEPRPGLTRAVAAATTQKFEAVTFFDGQRFTVEQDTSGGSWVYQNGSIGTIDKEGSGNLSFDDPAKIQWAEAAGNLYVTADDGVYRVTSASDTSAYRAGIPRAHARPTISLISAGFGSGLWLAAGDFVAYRFVIAREVNNRVIRGEPSGRVIVENTEAGTRAVRFGIIYLPEGILEGDVVEIYRSNAVSTSGDDTSDDMRLALTLRVSASQASLRTIVQKDDGTPEDKLGAFLYTNETQQGILQSNTRPPKADTLALYNRMLFYGGTQQPHRHVIKFIQGGSTEDQFLERSVLGDFTSGSPTITNVSSFEGVELNQNVADTSLPSNAGTYIPANTTITAFDAGAATITMSNNATATATNQTFQIHDWIAFGGRRYWADIASGGASARDFAASADAQQTMAWLSLALQTDENAGDATVRVDMLRGDSNEAEIQIESLGAPPGTQFAITGTKSKLWQPPLSTSGTDVQSTTEDRPNRVYYSKLDQPEAVPLPHFVDIGPESNRILKMVPTRDSLMIFGTQGVWRLTGRTPESLRVDPFDSDLVLIHPHAADVLDNRVIAWTNRGIVAVSDVGVTPISDPFIESDLNPVQSDMLDDIISNEDPGASGFFVATNPNRSELYVGVPDAHSDNYCTTLYVFNTKTAAWTTWVVPTGARIHHGAVDRFNDRLVLVGTNTSNQRTVYRENDGVYNDDAAAYECLVEVVARTAKNPGRDKFWRQVIWGFDDFHDITSIDIGFTSSISLTLDEITETTDHDRTDGTPLAIRAFVSRDHARGAILYPRITVSEADAYFQLAYLSMTFEAMGDRVHR